MALVRRDRDAAMPELANTSAASIAWNVAPTDTLPVVRFDPKARERSLDMLPWGLIPYWPKDIKVGFAKYQCQG